MKLKLTDTIFIESDSYQYTLKEKRVSEKGEPYERNLGHYGTIRQLVRGLIEKEIKSATVHDIGSLSIYLDELETRIKLTLNKIGVPALLAENENNFKYIGQLERRNERLEKQLEELKQ